ncbi:MAG: dihydroorotase [Marinirhabdus sp.]
MGTLLLKSAIIVDALSRHHLKKRDVLIENGTVTTIAPKIENASAEIVKLPNLHISQGWFDSGVSFGEPGHEERETLANGLRVAAHSGFAHVALHASGNPVAVSKSNIRYLRAKAGASAVSLLPMGALCAGGTSGRLAELYDMHTEGAVAFYDPKKPLQNPNLLKIALQYVQGFNGLVLSFPMEASVAEKGVMNEGINSTELGLRGIPALAEQLRVARDLQILEYTGGRLHIPTISTKKSVQLIKEAKKKGLQVTCSVSINNLVLTDDALHGYGTRYKLMPPLRTETDRKALLKALKEGIIDGVTSDHEPMDIEHKKLEFDNANYGSIGLESCFGALLKQTGVETAVRAFTNLKKTFGVPETPIEEGAGADLTLFDPKPLWEFSERDILSTSKNAAMVGQTLQGRAYGIINKCKISLK